MSTLLSERLQVALKTYVRSNSLSKSEAYDRLSSGPIARSSVRQDLGGHIKKPSLPRLYRYSSVLPESLRALFEAAAADGIEYQKARDSARSPSDLTFEGTTRSEWNKPSWSDWKSALDLADDATWDSVSADVRQRIASSTLFGEASADRFTDANFFPLTEATGELNFNALDSAWRLRGNAPDESGLESTVETLANRHFDESFTEDESSAEGDMGTKAPKDVTLQDLSDLVSSHIEGADPQDVHSLVSDLGSYTGSLDLREAATLIGKAVDSNTGSVLDVLENLQDKGMKAPAIALSSTLNTKSAPSSVEPFTEKITEDDTEFKGSAKATVKDVDRSSNIVRVYYAAWSEDADGERFAKGAFSESIKKFGPQADKQRIVHLNQHIPKQPIGRPMRLEEDEHGLLSETKISETRLGQDVLTLYQDGVITEHSVGFKRQQEEQSEDDTTIITKALLLEGSNVTWGANSDTPFLGFKSAENALPALQGQLKSLRATLHGERLSNPVAKQVELAIEQIEQMLAEVEKTNADPNEDKYISDVTSGFLSGVDTNENKGRNKRTDSKVEVPEFDF